MTASWVRPLLVLLLLTAAAQAEEVSFRIHDRLDPVEIEETTSVYIDGQLIRTVHLDERHPHAIVEVRVEAGANPTYALCGSITVREPDGDVEMHTVDGSGTLTDVADRDFDAVAANDFTVFYLVDITEGRPPVETRFNPARSCAEALS